MKQKNDSLIVHCDCAEFVYPLVVMSQTEAKKKHGVFCVDCSCEIEFTPCRIVSDKESATNLVEIGF